MNKKEFYQIVEEAVEDPSLHIVGSEPLDTIRWDSLAAVMFLALMEERGHRAVAPEALSQCKTVADLLALAGDAVAD